PGWSGSSSASSPPGAPVGWTPYKRSNKTEQGTFNMKMIASVLLVCATAALADSGPTVTDSVGRTVQMPPKVERVYAAGPPAAVLVYTLCPEKLIGWPMKVAAGAEGYLAPAF